MSLSSTQFNIVRKRLQDSIFSFRNERFQFFALCRDENVHKLRNDLAMMQFKENINKSLKDNEASNRSRDVHEYM